MSVKNPLFLVAAAIGTVVIFLQFWGTGPTAIVSMLFLVMLVYFFAIRRLMGDDESRSLGDNIYYLGFLYTLISVAASLYQYSKKIHAEDIELSETSSAIVANFSIALATTILGLALRVCYGKGRDGGEDTDDPEYLVSDLSASLREVNAELRTSILVCQDFRRNMENSLNDSISDIQREVGGVAKESQNIVRNLVKVANDMERELNSVVSVFDKFHEDLKKSLENTISNTAETMKEEILKVIQGLTTQLKESISDLNNFQRTLTGAAKKTMTQVEGALTQSAQSISGNIAEISSTIKESDALLSQHSKNFGQSAELAGEKMEEFSKRIDVIPIPKSILNIEELVRNIQSASDKNVQKIEEIVDQLKRLAVSADKVAISEPAPKRRFWRLFGRKKRG